MRVLIAETDKAFLEYLQLCLWSRGQEVEIAGNGLVCLSMLHEFVPDVLVLDRDLLWGGWDGVIAHMCEDAKLAGIPVILVTDGDVSDLPMGSVHRQLRKPFRLADLLACIKSAARAATPQLNYEVPAIQHRVGAY